MLSNVEMTDNVLNATQSNASKEKERAIKFTSLTEARIKKRYAKKIAKNAARIEKTRKNIEKISEKIVEEKSNSYLDSYEIERLERKKRILEADLNVYLSREFYFNEKCEAKIEKYNRPIKIKNHVLHRISNFFKGIVKMNKGVNVNSVDRDVVKNIVDEYFMNLNNNNENNKSADEVVSTNKDNNVNTDNSVNNDNSVNTDNNDNKLNENIIKNNDSETQNNLGINPPDVEKENNASGITKDELIVQPMPKIPETDPMDDNRVSDNLNNQDNSQKDNFDGNIDDSVKNNVFIDNVNLEEKDKNDMEQKNDIGNTFTDVNLDSIDSRYTGIFENVKPTFGSNIASFHLEDLGVVDPNYMNNEVSAAVNENVNNQRMLENEIDRRYNEEYGNLNFGENEKRQLKEKIKNDIEAEREEEKRLIEKEKNEAKKAEVKAQIEAEKNKIFESENKKLQQSADNHKQNISELDSLNQKDIEELKQLKNSLEFIRSFGKSNSSASDLDAMLNDTGSNLSADFDLKRK